jgi:hypothetical protein
MNGTFYFANWVRDDEDGSWKPDLPDDWGYLVLFGSTNNNWLIAECSIPEEDIEVPHNIEEVPDQLDALLYSGKLYPPALALTKEKFSSYDTVPDSRDECCKIIANTIESYLISQSEHPYFMAKAKEECLIGGLFKDQYTWIVGFSKTENKVFWVTYDYFVYDSPVADFQIDIEKLERLPNGTI